MDLTKYELLFVQESGKYLDEAEDLLLAAEKQPADGEIWREIHGKLHSVKGMSRALGLDKIAGLAHSMENWCQVFQYGRKHPSPPVFRLLFQSIDLLRELVGHHGDLPSLEAGRAYDKAVERFQEACFSGGIDDQDLEEPGRRATIPPPSVQSVRVRYSLIDELLGLSQDILLLEKTLPRLPEEHLFPGFKNWLVHFRSMLKGLYFRLAQLRLMSFGDFAELFRRAVRDLAAEQGKLVDLKVIGDEVQADMALLDRLREPFIHILNNAVTHGIELPRARLDAGKSEVGTLSMKAERARDRLLLTVVDDGKGIDRKAIARYLTEHKGIAARELEQLNDAALLKTILQAGYTSSASTSQTSGRGIGMDVFAQTVENLGGSVRIESTEGLGTAITIDLPLVLSVIPCIIFEISPYILCIPTAGVDAIYRKGHGKNSTPCDVRDLRGLFRGTAPTVSDGYYLKITGFNQGNGEEDKPIHLLVDRVLGNTEILLLPASELIAKTGIFSGIGVMENGALAVLLDLTSTLALLASKGS